MAAPTVEPATHELMDLSWNVVYDLLEERGLVIDGLFVDEFTGIPSWLDRHLLYRRLFPSWTPAPSRPVGEVAPDMCSQTVKCDCQVEA